MPLLLLRVFHRLQPAVRGRGRAVWLQAGNSAAAKLRVDCANLLVPSLTPVLPLT